MDLPTPPGEKRKFAALEGWRGLCALFVATNHVGQFVPWHLGRVPVIANAYLYVDFFFVLSGFVIAHAYGKRIQSTSDIASFAVRRFGRLWPLHAAVLGGFVAFECLNLLLKQFAGGFSGHAPFTLTHTPDGLIANLVFLQGLAPWRGARWNVPSWTISVEFWTYLVFAGTCLVSDLRRISLRAALAVLGFLMILVGGRYMAVYAGFGLFRCICGFFLGSLIYEAFPSTRQLALPYPSLLEGLALMLAVLLVSVAGVGALSLAAPLVFAAVVYVFSFEAGAVSRILMSKPMARLGAWSYSIYLIHYALVLATLIVLKESGRLLGIGYFSAMQASEGGSLPIPGNEYVTDIAVFVYLGAVIWIASITYRYIETPWRRRFNAMAAPMAAIAMKVDALGAESD